MNSIIPLWDHKVNFFRDLSLNLKRNKKFYLEYLDNYNYKNVFAKNKFNNNEWSVSYYLLDIYFLQLKFYLEKNKKLSSENITILWTKSLFVFISII